MKTNSIARPNGLKMSYVLLLALIVGGMSACRHGVKPVTPDMNTVATSVTTHTSDNSITDVVNVIYVQMSEDGKSAAVACSRHEMVFTVTSADMIERLQAALQQQTPVHIEFDPAHSALLQVTPASAVERSGISNRQIQNAGQSIDLQSIQGDENAINHVAEMGVINTTETGLTAVVPDMATAQQMFNYFASQCCQNPGPYNIDHCITFQYCADGCYARAHKMCYLLNNKYHYATKKVFSFATGSYHLSVKAEKWCNQCITWWYHVAPLVTIQTATGPKAFVFDPAMFDEPVLLATWLHAQQNPACSSTPRVTAINIQPTSSYSPTMYGVTTMFDTDPLYSDTNSTLVSYRTLHTCP